MIDFSDSSEITAIVRRHDKFIWFRSQPDFWVMDWQKWHQAFVVEGIAVPDLDTTERFDIPVVNCDTADRFISGMRQFELNRNVLCEEFLRRYSLSKDWWDMADLFPVVFLDFDHKKLSAVYGDGVQYERYVPIGWSGEFIDFYNEYPETLFPTTEKFWIVDGIDLLKNLVA